MVISSKVTLFVVLFSISQSTAWAAPEVVLPPPPGESAALPDDLIKQADIVAGDISLKAIRKAGGVVFTTSFNRFDGFGDGPADSYDDSRDFPFRGDRPPLQTAMTPVLRVNGLDAQSCFECHSIVSRATIPFTMGVGGHGGISSAPMPKTAQLDTSDADGDGITNTTGRVINPPFMFGAGGVELVAKEMTRDLQAIKSQAQAAVAGTEFDLISKGVDFGSVTANGDGSVEIDISNEYGIDEDLVVRPFGRKGENFSIRDFDVNAMAFHFGIQALDIFDPDGDGIVDELTVGEMSALSVFLATLPKPQIGKLKGDAKAGKALFYSIGCISCHVPEMVTESRVLTQSFPEIATDPDSNVYIEIDLSKKPAKFEKSGPGIVVSLFADLKRHDMGDELAETTGGELDRFFTTARLWGVADSAPYLHDGRAATLTEAILAHGGEAEAIRDNFAALPAQQRIELLAFLRSLKLPNQKQVNKLSKLIANRLTLSLTNCKTTRFNDLQFSTSSTSTSL